MQTHEDFSESNNETVEYLVCSNEATLAYMANLGCIEMHPWHSRVQSWQYPDWCLVDLDPDDKNTGTLPSHCRFGSPVPEEPCHSYPPSGSGHLPLEI